jgi:hypothetical protein
MSIRAPLGEGAALLHPDVDKTKHIETLALVPAKLATSTGSRTFSPEYQAVASRLGPGMLWAAPQIADLNLRFVVWDRFSPSFAY